jgi:hypothetical protein
LNVERLAVLVVVPPAFSWLNLAVRSRRRIQPAKRGARGFRWATAGVVLGGSLAWFSWQAGWVPVHAPIESIPAEARSQQVHRIEQRSGPSQEMPSKSPAPQTPSSASKRLPAETAVLGPSSTSNSLAEPVSWRRVLEAQLALIRQGISPGSLDGILGSQTRAAIRAFQQKVGQRITGELDAATLSGLQHSEPLFVQQAVSPAELARLLPLA